jgi:hypothetical protein
MSDRHTCPMPKCMALVPRSMLACKPHWRELPAELRAEINGSWRDRKDNPRRHVLAVRAALGWYAQQTDTS